MPRLPEPPSCLAGSNALDGRRIGAVRPGPQAARPPSMLHSPHPWVSEERQECKRRNTEKQRTVEPVAPRPQANHDRPRAKNDKVLGKLGEP